MNEIAEHIVNLCDRPVCFEQLMKQLFDDYGLAMTFEQYVLVGSTVRSYLAWLKDTGRVTVNFSENMQVWQKR